MLQAFTIPSPATPKEHPRLPLVRYPSTQRCSSDRDSSRRTIRRTSRWTSGAQAGRRATHQRRISDASAMHEGQSNSQRDARCTSDRGTEGRAMDQQMDQRWTSDAGATSRADGRTMHEGQRNSQTNRQTRDGPAMDQRCTSDARATEQQPDQRWTSKPRTTTRADP